MYSNCNINEIIFYCAATFQPSNAEASYSQEKISRWLVFRKFTVLLLSRKFVCKIFCT
jgi:hypothetical protein